MELRSEFLKCKGVASIPTVLVLVGLIMTVAVLITTMSVAEMESTADLSSSARALYYAEAGARDALMRVARKKNYSGSYDIEMAASGCAQPFAGCASVTVDTGTSTKIIDASGRVGDFIRNVRMSVTLDSNGLISGFSWQQL